MKTVHYSFLVLALLLIAACAPTDTMQEDSDDTQEAAQEMPAMDDSAADEMKEETMDDKEDSVADIKSAFMKFSGLLPNYHITYKTNMQGGDQDLNGNMEMYSMKNKMRFDSKMNYDGQNIESQTYMLEDELITCTKQGSWTCMSLTPSDYEGVNINEDLEEAQDNVDELRFTGMSTRTIAGQKATCFTYDYDGYEQELCYTTKGAMLYMKTQSADSSAEFEAISYSDSVSASDFNPPAEPQSMDDMMKGMMPDGFEMPNY